MEIYNASYSKSWGMGAFQEFEYVITANTESEALGLALEAENETKAEDWSLTLINSSEPNASYISSRGS